MNGEISDGDIGGYDREEHWRLVLFSIDIYIV